MEAASRRQAGRKTKVLSLLLGLASTGAAAAQEGPRIAFAHEGDIWIMNADGTGRSQLTFDPAQEFDPSLSPDGQWIAFRSHAGGDPQVHLIGTDGSAERNLTNSRFTDYSPAFSPDGTQIAFASDRAARGMNVWIMDADGTNLRQLTGIPGISEYPSWSPDGTRLVFHCTFGRVLESGTGDFEVCAANADGTGLVQLTDAPGESKLPAWSPDGQWIAFASDRHGWPSLPDYLPEGYDPQNFGDEDIYLMAPDGTGVRNLTQNPRQGETMPVWMGREIVFSRYGCLFAMNAEGGEARELTLGAPCADAFPDVR